MREIEIESSEQINASINYNGNVTLNLYGQVDKGTIDGYTREVTGEDIKYTMDITKKINTEGNTTSETTQNTTPETNNIEGSE